VPAAKVKVIELAKELGVTSKDLMVAAEEISVSTSAASLKKPILPSRSTVITPSSKLLRICSQEICGAGARSCGVVASMVDPSRENRA